eukprot:TRINITY_DN7340_c0_g1_i2.p1 TRINITY_DN7340_c0_g1~~TRINITY_DN7340_c0_g1_i2.p1  ORF type:complete len:349 (+),score=66.99 TRINITY_DN7340_c0_g1_i2:246-1292(+)
MYSIPFDTRYPRRCLQSGNGAFSHSGQLKHAVDWDMPEGTDILAARDGVVTQVVVHSNRGGPTSDYMEDGNYIGIRHDDGRESQYVHLRQYGNAVQVGEQVRRGQLIGWSGNTGWSTTPHLHFHVMTYGTRHQPWQTVPFELEGGMPAGGDITPGQSLHGSAGDNTREAAQNVVGLRSQGQGPGCHGTITEVQVSSSNGIALIQNKWSDNVYELRIQNQSGHHAEVGISLSGENFHSTRGPNFDSLVPNGQECSVVHISSDGNGLPWKWSEKWVWRGVVAANLGVTDDEMLQAWKVFMNADNNCTGTLSKREVWGVLRACLLYTSDAADEEDSVDLGGRRIIKKKKNV